MMAEPPGNYMVRNALIFAFRVLRQGERLVNESSLRSPYEQFFMDVAAALFPNKKLELGIMNSEVEKFYNKRMTETEFMVNVQTKLLSKMAVGQGSGGAPSSPTGSNGVLSTVCNGFSQHALLFSVVWALLVAQNKAIFSKLPNLSGRQLWEIFIKLDTGSELKVHVDDLVDLTVRIFQANGHKESEENIKEWFCGEQTVDFWSYFSQLTEKFVGLLQINIIQEIHTNIVCEFLKEGRLEKKGHVVHNWKTRWFVLTVSTLNYFEETNDNRVLKGTVVINSSAQVQSMQEFRVRPHRFRVVCGETKNATEISAPNLKTLQDWMYAIKMAIKMHTIEGRNFLHKYRQAQRSVSRPFTLQGSTSMDRGGSSQSPTHRPLSSSKSVPIDSQDLASPTSSKQKQLTSPNNGRHKPLPAVPDSEEETHTVSEFQDSSTDYNDPPPLPPQRFSSNEVRSPPEVFDKAAFVEARRNSAVNRDRGRRHSSLEPGEVQHIGSETSEYALITKVTKKKKKKKSQDAEVSSLLSDAVKAQLPIDATEQIGKWDNEEKPKKKHSAGYVQLHFHNEDSVPKGKIMPENNLSKTPVDTRKTKFGYSTVVFESEKKHSDIEFAEQIKKKKPHAQPVPPPKYEPTTTSPVMPKHSSDSRLLQQTRNVDYSDIDFSKQGPLSSTGTSSPDLRQSIVADNIDDESGYVNVKHRGLAGVTGPPVPPRRGAAAIVEESPDVPRRKAS